MKKWLKVLLIILGIIAFILLLLAGIGFYFYKYYSFYTARICLSNQSMKLPIKCESEGECETVLDEKIQSIKNKTKNLPKTLKVKIEKVFNKAVYCDNYCKVREVYGEGIGGKEHVESCKKGEEEITYEITGERALQMWSFLRKTGRI